MYLYLLDVDLIGSRSVSVRDRNGYPAAGVGKSVGVMSMSG